MLAGFCFGVEGVEADAEVFVVDLALGFDDGDVVA